MLIYYLNILHTYIIIIIILPIIIIIKYSYRLIHFYFYTHSNYLLNTLKHYSFLTPLPVIYTTQIYGAY